MHFIFYRYLKEFRTQQCPDFLQRRCTHHRPFACFNWHYLNQRRRRPVRKRDGTFNYSSDVYCTKYDETTGSCPEGDRFDWPILSATKCGPYFVALMLCKVPCMMVFVGFPFIISFIHAANHCEATTANDMTVTWCKLHDVALVKLIIN